MADFCRCSQFVIRFMLESAPEPKKGDDFMRGKSHHSLGAFLVQQYMDTVPKHHVKAFLFGCVQPDRNPVTYLKGSFRCQWLRGHNYQNARRFMRKISRRLEGKEKLNLFDYYTLGKLIHYTADAFTYVHNDVFADKLAEHRAYEAALQIHFLEYLQDDPEIDPITAHSVMDAIYQHHARYESQKADIHTDARYALSACCCILAVLFANRTL